MVVAYRLLIYCVEAAKPSYQEEYGRKHKTPWNDLFVDELRRGLVACRVFVFYPIYWVVYSQMLNNFVSQAATMELHNIPNDIMQVRTGSVRSVGSSLGSMLTGWSRTLILSQLSSSFPSAIA